MKKTLIISLTALSIVLAGCQAAPNTDGVQPTTPQPVENDQIKLETPFMNEVVKSPLTIKGEVKGYWMFEANFDVRLEDMDGRELATAPATALDDWMTEEFVPFESTLEFNPGPAAEGKIIFLEAFPSGGIAEGEERRSFEVPVRFVAVE